MPTRPKHQSAARPRARESQSGAAPPQADLSRIVDQVRERYGRIAEGKESGCCPPASTCGEAVGAVAAGIGYKDRDLEVLPAGANLGLGGGAPIHLPGLQARESALHLR